MTGIGLSGTCGLSRLLLVISRLISQLRRPESTGERCCRSMCNAPYSHHGHRIGGIGSTSTMKTTPLKPCTARVGDGPEARPLGGARPLFRSDRGPVLPEPSCVGASTVHGKAV